MTFAERFGKLVGNASASILGGAVLYRPGDGGEATVRGIWSNPYSELDGEHGSIATRAPTLDVRRSEIVDCFGGPPQAGDTIEIRDGVLGVLRYIVTGEPEDDGQGMFKLFLQLVE
jgi:hypothetical protein